MENKTSKGFSVQRFATLWQCDCDFEVTGKFSVLLIEPLPTSARHMHAHLGTSGKLSLLIRCPRKGVIGISIRTCVTTTCVMCRRHLY
jgi:hypothetical protein